LGIVVPIQTGRDWACARCTNPMERCLSDKGCLWRAPVSRQLSLPFCWVVARSENLDAIAIYEADRVPVVAALAATRSKARNEWVPWARTFLGLRRSLPELHHLAASDPRGS
jgi:hypothetical protein